MEEIQRLQDNLLLMRHALGWSAEELGGRIGVTRQTINNIESNRGTLSKTQYIAIRAIFDAEMAENPQETEILKYLLDVLVDNPDKYNEKDRDYLLGKANMLTPSIMAKTTSRGEVSKEFAGLVSKIGAFAMLSSVVGLGVGAWVMKMLNDKKKEG